MKAKSWIVIGIIFFIFMTYNNLTIVAGVIGFGGIAATIGELDKSAPIIHQILYVSWLIYAILHILSVYVIIKGVKKRRIENGITIDKSKNKVEERENSSLEILKKRYASGEISEEEFNKIKKDLE